MPLAIELPAPIASTRLTGIMAIAPASNSVKTLFPNLLICSPLCFILKCYKIVAYLNNITHLGAFVYYIFPT